MCVERRSMNVFTRALTGALAILAIAGCGPNNRLEPRSGLVVAHEGELPAPSAIDAKAEAEGPSVLGPLDKIEVTVFGLPELSKVVQISADGRVSLPLIGAVAAAGLTTEQLSTEIAARLRARYVREPDVSVTLDTSNQTVAVDGAVQRPGIFPVSNRMSLMRAIASGGGITNDADLSYVVVFREVAGKKYVALYDLRAIRQGAYEDPRIYANDVVVVGDSPGRRIFQMAIQGGSLLVAPLIAILN